MKNIYPNPIRIEFELTNYCNANCEFCPRFNIDNYGFMEIDKYEVFIKKLANIKKDFWINKKNKDYPVIVFGGYGEPLMHPRVFDFIKIAKENNFKTELITNGALLSKDNCDKILKSNLDNISISLHTLNKKLNKKITGLPDVIPSMEKALEVFDSRESLNVEIWRVSRLDGGSYVDDDSESYQDFLKKFKKKIRVFGPTPAWNRGGQFDSTFYQLVNDSAEIKCHVAYFTWSVLYSGDMVKCCCDFSTKRDYISRNWSLDIDEINKNILNIEKNFPEMCQQCRRPKIDYYKSI